jgi:TetR/AcrR family transcriptional regulator, transcriptional repressor for nem operon
MRTRTPQVSTRDRIVHAAMHLFWEKGFAATSVSDILTRSKSRSGSFYHFFQSKDALLHAVLDLYAASFEAVIAGPAFAVTDDPIERILTILAGYRQRLLQTDCTYGCPIGRLALEIDPSNGKAFQRIADNFSAWRGAVETCLREVRLPRGTNRRDVATFVLTVMEGGVMQSRTYRSIDPFDAGVRQLRKYFELLLG